jgi:hypothetical protein
MNVCNEVDKNFNELYAIPEFKNVRKDLLITISKTIVFLFKTTLIKDLNIAITIIGLIQPYLGNDVFNQKYLKFQKSLSKEIK